VDGASSRCNHGMIGRSTLLRFPATGTAGRRLICLPYAGGTAATYRTWPQWLPADVEVLTARLPGREPPYRDRPLESVAEIVDSLLPVVAEIGDLPFAIFGHSMGAAVAFELAVALEEMDGAASPAVLFVSSRRPPDEPSVLPPVHHLPDAEFVSAVRERYNAIPDVVAAEPDLLALLLPVLRADIRAFETYQPLTERAVRCPVHVYGGSDDVLPRPEQLAGWQRVSECDVRVRVFPGGHFYLTSNQEELTADIASAWDSVGVMEGT
jgi:medium-chain acyl-[acyl-carrier-protein] hydrolase